MILEAISFNLYAAGLVHARGRGKGRKGEREGGGMIDYDWERSG